MFFKWANLGLFFVYFRSFQTKILQKKTVGISRIQTRIVIVEGMYAYHLITTTAHREECYHSIILPNRWQYHPKTEENLCLRFYPPPDHTFFIECPLICFDC